MILHFSGTGNSRYIARRIADVTGDELVSINDRIKNNDTGIIEATLRLVFVVPTYAWRIPKIAEQWILKTKFVKETRSRSGVSTARIVWHAFPTALCRQSSTERKAEGNQDTSVSCKMIYITQDDYASVSKIEDIRWMK